MKNIIKQILLFAFIFGFLITPNYSYAQEGNDRDINLYRKNIEWKKGSPIFWTISDWAVVCLNADAPAPVNVGENKNIKFTDLSKIYDQTLLKILYYGYGGPNEWIELSKTLNSEMTTANDGTKILQFETFDGNTKTSISGEDAAYHRTHLYISNYYSPKFTPEFSDRIYLAKEYKELNID
ncbi:MULTISPECIES: hypothetical protein [Helcococcus]|uniref:Uncharacterized protein n=1 Tax=Helcococcus bovis TaxID=3153252 RepID=A0ABW9F5L8_9FIRM